MKGDGPYSFESFGVDLFAKSRSVHNEVVIRHFRRYLDLRMEN